MFDFFCEDIEFELNPIFPEDRVCLWLENAAAERGYSVEQINYIFCSDEYLLEMNQEHLGHDFYTDIITFDMRDDPESSALESDIFISIDRVKENAAEMKKDFESELLRVLAHGLLHLTGCDDETDEEEAEMRKEEDKLIALFHKKK